jgi:transaldolase / glucose-6-phosphate isomerase
MNAQTFSLPRDFERAFQASLEDWRRGDNVRRLWAKDASLWTGGDEGRWLGWLDVAERQRASSGALKALAGEVSAAGVTRVLLLGMGGSSLCADIIASTFPGTPGMPELRILDSTDPAQVAHLEDWAHRGLTLYVVSSKSGTTLEPNVFMEYFLNRSKAFTQTGNAEGRFVAITDPGSSLEATAQREGFGHLFYGEPSVGGRFSALSSFGMVPAALMGIDPDRFLAAALRMAGACGPDGPVEANPGVVLGTLLGSGTRLGRDKITIFSSPALRSLGAWLEQLIAESTGKDGTGIIPLDGEEPGHPSLYGNDRLFVYIRFEPAPDPLQDRAVDELARAGHPVIRISVDELYGMAAEFYRWEFAVAVAGSILGINPFNQPDVEAAKVEARRLTAAYEETGRLPPEEPLAEFEGLKAFADPANGRVLAADPRNDGSLKGFLRAHLARLRPGDYFALLAFIEMNAAHDRPLQAIRRALRKVRGNATSLGYGPRFLHSTGQLHKGGPDSGLFLQVTGGDAVDLPVPGRRLTFGAIKAAQARGDLQVLADRGRRLLRIHMGKDVPAGLERLLGLVEESVL